MRNKLIPIISLMLMTAFIIPDKKRITVWLIGDSTMADKEEKAFPEAGWGTLFAKTFDSKVTVNNRARNGRSTKSFIAEGLWKEVIENVKKGDWVFIQFGHNDEVKEKVGRYTTPDEFRANLTRYVNETRQKKGNPVLLTPVARRKFDSLGKIVDTHAEYSAIVRSVAAELKVTLIDHDKLSQKVLQEMGPDMSKHIYLHLSPGQHPNYPEGKADDTHFNELGANKMGALVTWDIIQQKLELKNRILTPQARD